MVRGCRTLPSSRSGAVQLLAADAFAAHQPRELAAARQKLARSGGSLVSTACRGRRQQGAAADVCAIQAARYAAEKSHRRVADGAIQGGRRLSDRLASRALRRARQGRRRSRLHRDDLRQSGRPHHARLHRHVCAGARSGVEAHRRFRTPRNRRKNLLPTRPFRRQGLDPARLGGNGCAAQRRQLAGHVRVCDIMVRAQPARPRDGSRRYGSRAPAVRRCSRDGATRRISTCSKSIARTAICCLLLLRR